jgi:hypothetical protein
MSEMGGWISSSQDHGPFPVRNRCGEMGATPTFAGSPPTLHEGSSLPKVADVRLGIWLAQPGRLPSSKRGPRKNDWLQWAE